jgi:hypothetical protein
MPTSWHSGPIATAGYRAYRASLVELSGEVSQLHAIRSLLLESCSLSEVGLVDFSSLVAPIIGAGLSLARISPDSKVA